MSLDDKFNSNDGSLIDRIDNVMVGLHKKIGDFWQNKKHKSIDILKRNLYGISTSGFISYSIIASDYLVTPIILYTAIGTFMDGKISPKNSSEVKRRILPAKAWKYGTSLLYNTGVFLSFIGMGSTIAGTISGDNNLIKEGLATIGFGIGCWSMSTADYLHKSDFEQSPKQKNITQ